MSMILDALGFAGNVLDVPGSVARGVLAGRPDKAFGGVFNPEDRVSGRGLLESLGMLAPKEGDGFDMGDAAGIGASILTDPLTFLPMGGIAAAVGSKALKGGKAVKAAIPAAKAVEVVAPTAKVAEAALPVAKIAPPLAEVAAAKSVLPEGFKIAESANPLAKSGLTYQIIGPEGNPVLNNAFFPSEAEALKVFDAKLAGKFAKSVQPEEAMRTRYTELLNKQAKPFDLAGESRRLTPEELNNLLPPAEKAELAALQKRLNAPIEEVPAKLESLIKLHKERKAAEKLAISGDVSAAERLKVIDGKIGDRTKVVSTVDPEIGMRHDLIMDGKSRGSMDLGPASKIEAGAAERMFPGVTSPGDTVSRIHGIEINSKVRDTGLGQKLYLEAMNNHGSKWYYNSQTEPGASNVYKALAEKGLVEIRWKGGSPSWGQPGGIHLVRLTDKGREAAIAGQSVLNLPGAA